MEDLQLEPLKEFQKNINESLNPLRDVLLRFSESILSSNSLSEMTKTVSSAIQSITETYNNECSELLKRSSEAIKSMTFDIPKYDLTPIIESLSTVHLENDEEILIKLDDDDVKLINDIDSSLEPKKEKFWTFEKISFLITTLLAIIQIFQSGISDIQSSQQLDEISTKIEEHWIEEDKKAEENKEYQERIISLLETITSQLQKEDNQSSDEDFSSLSE